MHTRRPFTVGYTHLRVQSVLESISRSVYLSIANEIANLSDQRWATKTSLAQLVHSHPTNSYPIQHLFYVHKLAPHLHILLSPSPKTLLYTPFPRTHTRSFPSHPTPIVYNPISYLSFLILISTPHRIRAPSSAYRVICISVSAHPSYPL